MFPCVFIAHSNTEQEPSFASLTTTHILHVHRERRSKPYFRWRRCGIGSTTPTAHDPRNHVFTDRRFAGKVERFLPTVRVQDHHAICIGGESRIFGGDVIGDDPVESLAFQFMQRIIAQILTFCCEADHDSRPTGCCALLFHSGQNIWRADERPTRSSILDSETQELLSVNLRHFYPISSTCQEFRGPAFSLSEHGQGSRPLHL